jgi:hypothetical protein
MYADHPQFSMLLQCMDQAENVAAPPTPSQHGEGAQPLLPSGTENGAAVALLQEHPELLGSGSSVMSVMARLGAAAGKATTPARNLNR